MTKMKLNSQDLSDRVWFVMKTRQDNNVTDGTGVVYTKNNIEQLEPIGPGVVHYENHIGQRHDQLYSYGLRREQNWTDITNRIGCSLWRKPDRTTTWLIIQV